MGKRTKWIRVAVSVTALDAVVVAHYGSVVWKAFAAVIWSKLFVILLAAVWATTLLNIWAHAWSQLRQVIHERPLAVSIPANGLSADLTEEIDV